MIPVHHHAKHCWKSSSLRLLRVTAFLLLPILSSESLPQSAPVLSFKINRSPRELRRVDKVYKRTRGGVLYTDHLHRPPKQTKLYKLKHCPVEWSTILNAECFMQNLTNTFYVNSSQLRNNSDTQTTIFADQVPNCFNISLCFWDAASCKSASSTDVSRPSLNLLNDSKIWMRDNHSWSNISFNIA